MIILSPTISSILGSLNIRNYPGTPTYSSPSRINRVATLDGGTAINHYGVAIGDRSQTVKCRLTEAEETTLKAFHEGAYLLRSSSKDGVFSVYIADLNIGPGREATILFYLKEQLA